MDRSDLLDKIEEIQDKANNENLGSNEAELQAREEIADLFYSLVKNNDSLHSVSGSLPIWTTDCPTCKTGTLLLYEKGGSAKCDNCDKTFYTDYEVHDELTTREVEYWLTD